MVDYWSTQERCIVSGFELGFIVASGSIDEGDILKFSTTAQTDTQVDGVVTMEEATALADGLAISLKTTTSGDVMPVLFYGVHKLAIGGTGTAGTEYQIYAGSLVINSSSDTYIIPAQTGIIATNSAKTCYYSGASHILGTAMQHGDDLDEILVLVGRTH